MTTHAADLEALWHSHHDSLMRYMRRRMPVDMAEDLVQDVYLSAWEAMTRGMGYRDNATGWLFRIAHNAVIDCYRVRDRMPEQVEIDALVNEDDGERGRTYSDVVVDGELTPPEKAILAMEVESVLRAIDNLPNHQTEVVLRCLAGYSYTEISDGMGKHKEAIKGIYQRGVTSVRNRFDPAYMPPPSKSTAPAIRVVRKRVRIAPLVAKIQGALLQHGPLLASELSELLEKGKPPLLRVLKNHERIFTVVGSQMRKGHEGRVWGLVGVHDQQDAV